MRVVSVLTFLAAASSHVMMGFTNMAIRNANTPTSNGRASVAGPCGGVDAFGANGKSQVKVGQTVQVQIAYAAGHAAPANVFRLAYACGKPGQSILGTTSATQTQIPTQPEPAASVGKMHTFSFTIPATGAGVDAGLCTVSLLDQRNWGGCVDLEVAAAVDTPPPTFPPTDGSSNPQPTKKPTKKPTKNPTVAGAPTFPPTDNGSNPRPTPKPTGQPTVASPPPGFQPNATALQGTCKADRVQDCSGNCWLPLQLITNALGNGVCNDYLKYGLDLNCAHLGCDGGDCTKNCIAVDSGTFNPIDMEVDQLLDTNDLAWELSGASHPQLSVSVVFSVLYISLYGVALWL